MYIRVKQCLPTGGSRTVFLGVARSFQASNKNKKNVTFESIFILTTVVIKEVGNCNVTLFLFDRIGSLTETFGKHRCEVQYYNIQVQYRHVLNIAE